MDVGKFTGGGFLPKSPELDELLEKVGGQGWDGLMKKSADPAAGQALVKAATGSNEDIARDFAAMYADSRGRRILEFLLDNTLRCGMSHPDPMAGIEQEALWIRERKGQNAIVIMMLSMIQRGLNLPAPGSEQSR